MLARGVDVGGRIRSSCICKRSSITYTRCGYDGGKYPFERGIRDVGDKRLSFISQLGVNRGISGNSLSARAPNTAASNLAVPQDWPGIWCADNAINVAHYNRLADARSPRQGRATMGNKRAEAVGRRCSEAGQTITCPLTFFQRLPPTRGLERRLTEFLHSAQHYRCCSTAHIRSLTPAAGEKRTDLIALRSKDDPCPLHRDLQLWIRTTRVRRPIISLSGLRK